MKKTLAMVLAMGMTIASLTACGGSKPAETTAAATEAQTEAASSATDTKAEVTEPAGGKAEGPITVVSRLGSKKLREILTLLCCITLSSSRKTNASAQEVACAPKGVGRAPHHCGPLVTRPPIPSAYIFPHIPNTTRGATKTIFQRRNLCTCEIPSRGLFWCPAGG